MKKIYLFLSLLVVFATTAMAQTYVAGERKSTFADGDKVIIFSTCMVNGTSDYAAIFNNNGSTAGVENTWPDESYRNNGSSVWVVKVLDGSTDEQPKLAFKPLNADTYWGIGGVVTNTSVSEPQTFTLVNFTNWSSGGTIITGLANNPNWCGADVWGLKSDFTSVAPADITADDKLWAVVAGTGYCLNTNGDSYQSANTGAYPIAFYEAVEIPEGNLITNIANGKYLIRCNGGDNTNYAKYNGNGRIMPSADITYYTPFTITKGSGDNADYYTIQTADDKYVTYNGTTEGDQIAIQEAANATDDNKWWKMCAGSNNNVRIVPKDSDGASGQGWNFAVTVDGVANAAIGFYSVTDRNSQWQLIENDIVMPASGYYKINVQGITASYSEEKASLIKANDDNSIFKITKSDSDCRYTIQTLNGKYITYSSAAEGGNNVTISDESSANDNNKWWFFYKNIGTSGSITDGSAIDIFPGTITNISTTEPYTPSWNWAKNVTGANTGIGLWRASGGNSYAQILDVEATCIYTFIKDTEEVYRKEYSFSNLNGSYPEYTLPCGVNGEVPTGAIDPVGINNFVITKEIPVTYSLPFVPADSYDKITNWYTMTLRSKDLTSNLGVTIANNVTTKTPKNLYAFVGNPFEGYKIFNAYYGSAKVLWSDWVDNSGAAVPMTDVESVTAGTDWVLNANDTGYGFRRNGADNAYINERDGMLSYWISGAGASDVGSRMIFTEATASLETFIENYKAEAIAVLNLLKDAGFDSDAATQAVTTLEGHTVNGLASVEFIDAQVATVVSSESYYKITNKSTTGERSNKCLSASATAGHGSDVANFAAMWRFIQDGTAFYLYNEYFNAYLGKPGTTQTGTVLTSNPVAPFKFNTAEVSSATVAGAFELSCATGTLHMRNSGSNFDLIDFDNDYASCWSVEKVDYSSEVNPAIKELYDAYNAKARYKNAVIGTSIGEYSGDKETLVDALGNAEDIFNENAANYAANGFTVDYIVNVKDIINSTSLLLNMPQKSKFYRIKGADNTQTPAGYYITGNTNSDGGRIALKADADDETIYYLTNDNNLQAVKSGNIIALSGSHYTFANANNTPTEITFYESPRQVGCYLIKSSNCYLHYKVYGGAVEIDRCTADEHTNHDWILTEVDEETAIAAAAEKPALETGNTSYITGVVINNGVGVKNRSINIPAAEENRHQYTTDAIEVMNGAHFNLEITYNMLGGDISLQQLYPVPAGTENVYGPFEGDSEDVTLAFDNAAASLDVVIDEEGNTATVTYPITINSSDIYVIRAKTVASENQGGYVDFVFRVGDVIAKGCYYRLKAYNNSDAYMVVGNPGTRLTVNSAPDIAASIFYLNENSQLINYKNGTGLADTYNSAAIGVEPHAITFTVDGDGYNVKTNYSGSKILYHYDIADDATSANVDRNSGTAGDRTRWIVEEVTTLPVIVPATGYTTFYAPVAVNVADGVTAHTVSILGNKTALSTPLSVIPKNTGVILYAEGISAETKFNFEINNEDVEVGVSSLTGTVAATYVTDDAYILPNEFTGDCGLYKATKDQQNSTAFLNSSHKAYLLSEPLTPAQKTNDILPFVDAQVGAAVKELGDLIDYFIGMHTPVGCYGELVGQCSSTDSECYAKFGEIAEFYSGITSNTTKEEIDAQKAALDAIMETFTVVSMPVDGKAYTFTNVTSEGEESYLNWNGDAVVAVTRNNPEDVLPETATFICRKLENGKYVFVNNAGKYLVFQCDESSFCPDGVGKGVLGAYDTNSTTKYCDWTLTHAGLKNEHQMKTFLMEVQAKGKINYLLQKFSTHTFHSADKGNTFNDGDLSSYWRLDEVSYSNKPILTEITDDDELVTVNGSSIATFSAPFPTIVPDGVTAYVATTDGSDDVVYIEPIEGAIPANTGVILVGQTSSVVTMKPAAGEAEATWEGENKFSHSAGAAKALTDGEGYILAKGNNGIGFYATSGGTLAMNKSYLAIAQGASFSIRIRTLGHTTEIDDVDVERGQVNAIYDLQGRKLDSIPGAGMYIVNGKKVLVK